MGVMTSNSQGFNEDPIRQHMVSGHHRRQLLLLLLLLLLTAIFVVYPHFSHMPSWKFPELLLFWHHRRLSTPLFTFILPITGQQSGDTLGRDADRMGRAGHLWLMIPFYHTWPPGDAKPDKMTLQIQLLRGLVSHVWSNNQASFPHLRAHKMFLVCINNLSFYPCCCKEAPWMSCPILPPSNPYWPLF